MLTIDQLLHGLAALLGLMVGKMLSPEFLIPSLVAFYYVKRPRDILLHSIPCAVIGTMVFISLHTSKYAASDFLIRYLGSILFISIIYYSRVLIREIKKPKPITKN